MTEIPRIAEAIAYYKEKTGKKMTQKQLGKHVLQTSPQVSEYYISMWKKGKELTKFKPEHIVRICEATGVDPNFLFDY